VSAGTAAPVGQSKGATLVTVGAASTPRRVVCTERPQRFAADYAREPDQDLSVDSRIGAANRSERCELAAAG
jgi:hypothetical protein